MLHASLKVSTPFCLVLSTIFFSGHKRSAKSLFDNFATRSECSLFFGLFDDYVNRDTERFYSSKSSKKAIQKWLFYCKTAQCLYSNITSVSTFHELHTY